MDDQIQMDLPVYHSWPQLYTIQKNLDTRERQMTMWQKLIFDYAKAKGTYTLTFNELYGSKICVNKEINRRLSMDNIKQIAAWMVANKFADYTTRGPAEGDHDKVFVYWRSLQEVADAIFKWAKETGRIGSIETVLDMIDDDL